MYVWAVLAYTLGVILWGAYVRAAGAGNGCGDHWPLCDGQFLPAHPQIKMLIEFLHRVSSGVDAVLIAGVVAGAFWLFPKRHAVRRGAVAAGFFILTEALLGAALVLFGWVGTNVAPARFAADATHLANTLLLLAALAVTAAWAGGMVAPRRGPGWRLGLALAGVIVTGAAGAIAAVGDTLFPAASLTAGLRADFSGATRLMERIRVIHPAIALVVGAYILYLAYAGLAADGRSRRLAALLGGAVLLQWACGLCDLLLLAPTGMQMLHLLTADLLWLALVVYCADVLAWQNAKADLLFPVPAGPRRAAGGMP